MNILVFNYEYPPLGGGGGVINALIAEELAKRHRVRVLTSAYGDLPPREWRNGVEVHRLWVPGRRARHVASLRSLLWYPATAYRRGLRITADERVDIIHGHFAVPTGLGSIAVARRRKIPHVLSLHGGDLYDPSKRLSPHRIGPLRWAVDTVLQRSDVVVAQSTNTRDNVYRYYRYSGPVEIIPLGIAEPPPGEGNRRALDVPEDAFLAVTVGRLVSRKNTDRLLHVLARAECRDVHLIVVGSGPELPALRTTASECGLDSRVHFAGFVDEARKWEILRSADVYVSATRHEGFGLVYLEAMMAGLPIVTFDHGGHTDFLTDGDNGRLVPAGDEDGLAEAIAYFAGEPAEAKEIGAQNLCASRSYTVAACARTYERLFEHLVNGDAGSDWREREDRWLATTT